MLTPLKSKKFIKVVEKIIDKHNNNNKEIEKSYVVSYKFFDWKFKISKFKKEILAKKKVLDEMKK
jgi:hypothetical protein